MSLVRLIYYGSDGLMDLADESRLPSRSVGVRQDFVRVNAFTTRRRPPVPYLAEPLRLPTSEHEPQPQTAEDPARA